MSVNRSSSKLAWGLCLALAGAALVAGTNDITAEKGWSRGMLGVWECCAHVTIASECSAVVVQPGLGGTARLLMSLTYAPPSNPNPVQHADVHLS